MCSREGWRPDSQNIDHALTLVQGFDFFNELNFYNATPLILTEAGPHTGQAVKFGGGLGFPQFETPV